MTLEELNQNEEITLKSELWKEIKDFENYAVSNYGRVFNLRKKDFKKFSVNSFFNYSKRAVKSIKYLAINLRWVSLGVNTEFARTDELQKYNRWLLEKIKDY